MDGKDPEFDEHIRQIFGQIHKKVVKGDWDAPGEIGKRGPWRDQDPLGALAEIIVLDQFTRFIYRGTPRAYENDNAALQLALAAIERKYPEKIYYKWLGFLYLPFMHCEYKEMHVKAVELFS